MMHDTAPEIARSGRKPVPGVTYRRLREPLDGSLTAFDEHNARIKVFDTCASPFLGSGPAEELVAEILSGGAFSKLTVYSRDQTPGETGSAAWEQAGFRAEAVLKAFYQDDRDALVWSFFAPGPRGLDEDGGDHDRIVADALAAADRPAGDRQGLATGCVLRRGTVDDAEAISALLSANFDAYPSDCSADSLARLIGTSRSMFRIATDRDGRLLAAASAEVDVRRGNAEITDCVTRQEARGKGLSTALVTALHGDLRATGLVRSVYSLARAVEPGINRVLARLGYQYTGRLVNNCRMPTGWESMNAWSRRLDRDLAP